MQDSYSHNPAQLVIGNGKAPLPAATFANRVTRLLDLSAEEECVSRQQLTQRRQPAAVFAQ